MKQDLNFLYYVLQCELLCVPISGSGFCQWVWILPVGLDMKTPWARLPVVSCDLHTTMV